MIQQTKVIRSTNNMPKPCANNSRVALKTNKNNAKVFQRAEIKARLDAILTERGGQLLSTEFLGRKRRHQFQCSHGHIWETTAAVVLQGSWCPHCALTAKRARLAAKLESLVSQICPWLHWN